MKKFIYIAVLICIFFPYSNINARTSIGKIIQLTGDIDLTDVTTGYRVLAKTGTNINTKQRIRTGQKSYAEILLKDNTKIFLYELSVLQINNIRNERRDPPTEIKFHLGKIRINIDKNFEGRNLILKTNTAILGVRNIHPDFMLITTDYQTKLAVLEGQIDIASINPEIQRSYMVRTNEEINVRQNYAPSKPVAIPQEILDTWLEDYYIVDKKHILKREKQKISIFDYILRKRKY